ncbi:MAG: hypothetical protein RDV48_13925 [Candidatus Eremiobacteraeota bacterium]|nr:hypothetical protein [Candidatus Eremiobacteraeota bacterium]
MPEKDTIRLAYQPRKDEVMEYHVVTSSLQHVREGDRAATHEYCLEMLIEERIVREVPPDAFDAEFSIREGSVTKNSMTTPLRPAEQTLTVTMRKNGEIIASSVRLPFVYPSFPERDLSPGDSWRGSGEVLFPAGAPSELRGKKRSLTFDYEYTYEGLLPIGDLECAVIAVSCPGTSLPAGDNAHAKITAGGKVFFAHRQGRLLGFHMTTATVIDSGDAHVESRVTTKLELAV